MAIAPAPLLLGSPIILGEAIGHIIEMSRKPFAPKKRGFTFSSERRPRRPRRQCCPSMCQSLTMDTTLIGRAKELQVASLLIAEGIYVFWPLVDVGFDLVASNASGTLFMPVQVRFRETRTGFTLNRSEIEKFATAKAILAFGSKSGESDASDFWFMTAGEWKTHANDKNRGDGRVSVYFSDGTEWFAGHKGKDGLKRAFKDLLATPPTA